MTYCRHGHVRITSYYISWTRVVCVCKYSNIELCLQVSPLHSVLHCLLQDSNCSCPQNISSFRLIYQKRELTKKHNAGTPREWIMSDIRVNSPNALFTRHRPCRSVKVRHAYFIHRSIQTCLLQWQQRNNSMNVFNCLNCVCFL